MVRPFQVGSRTRVSEFWAGGISLTCLEQPKGQLSYREVRELNGETDGQGPDEWGLVRHTIDGVSP